jgi:hypothetical protein
MISELKTSVAAACAGKPGRVILSLAALLAGLAGCGQKGALVLPSPTAPAASAAVAK